VPQYICPNLVGGRPCDALAPRFDAIWDRHEAERCIAPQDLPNPKILEKEQKHTTAHGLGAARVIFNSATATLRLRGNHLAAYHSRPSPQQQTGRQETGLFVLSNGPAESSLH
jgi:hypothetical protein